MFLICCIKTTVFVKICYYFYLHQFEMRELFDVMLLLFYGLIYFFQLLDCIDNIYFLKLKM